jgi:hypothetical protein
LKAVFIELPAFERHRDDYLDDDGFAQLQVELMVNPVAGDLIGERAGFASCGSKIPAGRRAGVAVCA